MDFVETMNNANRLCTQYLNKNNGSCDGCRLMVSVGGTTYTCTSLCMSRPELYAAIVDQWAKEEPEPVYPTWQEWLIDRGLAIKKIGDCELSHTVLTADADRPISAEDAEKLGISPVIR